MLANLYIFLNVLILFWCTIFIIDVYLQSNARWYVEFRNWAGLQISPFMIRIHINKNSGNVLRNFCFPHVAAIRATKHLSKFKVYWLSLGAFISLICFVLTPIYLTSLLYLQFSYDSDQQTFKKANTVNDTDDQFIDQLVNYDSNSFEQAGAGITPVLPGINVPFSHVPVLLVVLIIASTLHELGHSMAARNANVSVNGFGFFLLVLYPGAFVEIDSNELERASYAQKIRIFTAGIWHNLILSTIAFLLIHLLPLMLIPLFQQNSGVMVLNVLQKSGLYGTNGLNPSDVITAINRCEIRDMNDWKNCLRDVFIAQKNQLSGFVASRDLVLKMTAASTFIKNLTDSGETSCCEQFNNIVPSSHICFKYILDKSNKRRQKWINMNDSRQINNAYLLGQNTSKKAENRKIMHACLPVNITESPTCDFSLFNKQQALYNTTVLLKFKLRRSDHSIFYVGSITEPSYTIELTSFTPRYTAFYIPYWIPYALHLFLKYLAMFSFAMGVLNSLPVYGMDGQFMALVLINYFGRNFSKRMQRKIYIATMAFGTTIFMLNVLLGFTVMLWTNYQTEFY